MDDILVLTKDITIDLDGGKRQQVSHLCIRLRKRDARIAFQVSCVKVDRTVRIRIPVRADVHVVFSRFFQVEEYLATEDAEKGWAAESDEDCIESEALAVFEVEDVEERARDCTGRGARGLARIDHRRMK